MLCRGLIWLLSAIRHIDEYPPIADRPRYLRICEENIGKANECVKQLKIIRNKLGLNEEIIIIGSRSNKWYLLREFNNIKLVLIRENLSLKDIIRHSKICVNRRRGS